MSNMLFSSAVSKVLSERIKNAKLENIIWGNIELILLITPKSIINQNNMDLAIRDVYTLTYMNNGTCYNSKLNDLFDTICLKEIKEVYGENIKSLFEDSIYESQIDNLDKLFTVFSEENVFEILRRFINRTNKFHDKAISNTPVRIEPFYTSKDIIKHLPANYQMKTTSPDYLADTTILLTRPTV